MLRYTFLTHPWVFRSKDHATGELVVDGSPVCWPSLSHVFQDVVEAPWRTWTPASHATHFRPQFPGFATEVQQLLLAYNAQHRRPGGRHSSAGGGEEPDFEAPGCCAHLWKSSGQGAADTPGLSVAKPAGQGSLGSLPHDLVIKIVSYLTPQLRAVRPIVKEAVQVLPPGVGHSAWSVVYTAARLLGPAPRRPQPPAAGPDAWLEAAGMVQRAGGGPPGMQLPARLPAWPMAAGAAMGRAAEVLADAARQMQHAIIAQAAAAAANPRAPLPKDTYEVLLYTEATALANTARTREERMCHEREAQVPALQRYVEAHEAARKGRLQNAAALPTVSS
ncbi:hypothetical protein HXX76_011473 [Chlamydomonas incerta]|uniref:Uncharacterized protein n=1 Tax=Chlamydomonas incerta TaxID=51695 RepID=A0A835VWT8_CHLIN|nr:hypothetical protein HXX76_011473 [Chlamydomonas incerta]|eukprot:KAG2428773.1 hypothetical protein HXX76_011473 [Chlamydomonas incerta]